FKLRRRPKFVIYHNYELAAGYGPLDVAMNRHAARLVDLITFPEENRARVDTAACGYDGIDKVIIYNCGDLMTKTRQDIAPAHQRNGKMIYYGTIARRVALSEYFLDDRIQGIQIDLYGRIMEPNEQATQEVRAGLRGSVRYHGLLDAEDLVRLRREYAFSVAMWNPTISDNHLYSAPNRLFSSIQAGVPPIVAPHPQCKMIVQRFDCGIVMRDWTFEAFRDALREGMRVYGTARYAKMVENCRRAAETDLNWDSQFEKIKHYLPERLAA
ncbi:MAG: glycosyltransferase family protein, partial [Planctomycetota bacterium]